MLYKCIQSIKPQGATVTTRTQTEKNVIIDLKVRIENSMLKNRVWSWSSESSSKSETSIEIIIRRVNKHFIR